MTQDGKNGLTYAQAGVDIDAGNALVERIKPAAARTKRPGVASGTLRAGPCCGRKSSFWESFSWRLGVTRCCMSA